MRPVRLNVTGFDNVLQCNFIDTTILCVRYLVGCFINGGTFKSMKKCNPEHSYTKQYTAYAMLTNSYEWYSNVRMGWTSTLTDEFAVFMTNKFHFQRVIQQFSEIKVERDMF